MHHTVPYLIYARGLIGVFLFKRNTDNSVYNITPHTEAADFPKCTKEARKNMNPRSRFKPEIKLRTL